MKVGIIECCNNSNSAKCGTSILAHTRVYKIIAKELGYHYFIDKQDLIQAATQRFDVLLFTASSAYAEHDLIQQILEQNRGARRIYLSNDYKVSPPSELKKYGEYDTIRAFHGKDKSGCRKGYFVNLNVLIAREPLPLTPKKHDCIYWGSCRKDREDLFREYLKGNTYLSTFSKAKKEFEAIGCTPIFLPKIHWKKSITNIFRYSLYIEDEATHSTFCNLANRWYEAGICNNVTFFDKCCSNTIRKSEIANVYDDFYTVNGYEDLQRKINECNKNFFKHLERQREWHKIDLVKKREALEQIKSIVEAQE